MLLEGNPWMLEEAWRIVLHDHDDWSLIGDRSMEEVGEFYMRNYWFPSKPGSSNLTLIGSFWWLSIAWVVEGS